MEIRIQGLAEAIVYADKVDRGLASLEPLMRRIAAILDENVRNRFEQEIDPDGTPWRPWAPRTAHTRGIEGITTKLRRTRKMIGTLHSDYTSDSATIAIGADVRYTAVHEFGTDEVPQRAMLGWDGELGTLDTASVTDALEKYINDLIG